jgi:peptidylprolyl isomerase
MNPELPYHFRMTRRLPLLNLLLPATLPLILATGCTRSIPPPDDVAAPPADSLKTSSGLSIKTLQKGTGTRHPRATDRVTVHYTGWTTDGEMFDSSVAKGQPATFALNQVIDGWTEGLQRMVEGEKARLWIPEDLAYGGAPGKPAGMLVFDVELIRIE